MKSKTAACIAVLVVLMMGAIAVGTDWDNLGYDTSDPGEPIPFMPSDDKTMVFAEDSLNGMLFEKYGALMLVVGALMFGAMIAGVCISREDDEEEADQ